MKKIFLIALSGAIAIVSFQSCKKDEGKSASPKDLIIGSWLQTGATEDGEDVWNSEYEPCEKDDVTTFKTNGTFVIDEGASKCDPDDPQIADDGTYEVSADGKIITIGGF